MSWKNTSVMEEKIRFIKAWESGAYSVTALCEAHGISRTTGYKLINRYLKEGENCFSDKSKRPKNVPHKTPKKMEEEIIRLREKYKNWGARKLIILLKRKFDEHLIPSETTVNKILDRNGLVKKRKRRPEKVTPNHPKYDPQNCNEIWSADYKGEFKLRNRRYCYPLTVSDKKSRFLFTSKGHYHPTFKAVKAEYRRIFRKFGLPFYIHTDNGSPFGSIRSVRRFSRICYWLIDNGVEPLFSDPGKPQQNGRHERMHRDLKAFCKNNIKNTLHAQQKIMDNFVQEYNYVRPHEALIMKTPSEVHQHSTRIYNGKKQPFEYDLDLKVLTVMKNGAIRWGAYQWVYVSTAAIKRKVGVKEIGNGIWQMNYRNVFLGYFDEKLIHSKEQYLRLKNKVV